MTTLTPQKRKQVDFSEEAIIIEVGNDGKRFTVHPSVLIRNSAFFRAMMSSNWKENADKMARLPGADANTFGAYISYVYSGVITVPSLCPTVVLSNENDPTGRHQYHGLVKLYILADMLQDTALKNNLINTLLDHIRTKCPSPFIATIELAFEYSRHDGALCTLLIDSHLAKTDPIWLQDAYFDLPAAFVQALMVGWATATWDTKAVLQAPDQVDPCKYHEHDEDAPMEGGCWRLPGKVAAAQTPKTPKKTGGGKRSARIAQMESPDYRQVYCPTS